MIYKKGLFCPPISIYEEFVRSADLIRRLDDDRLRIALINGYIIPMHVKAFRDCDESLEANLTADILRFDSSTEPSILERSVHALLGYIDLISERANVGDYSIRQLKLKVINAFVQRHSEIFGFGEAWQFIRQKDFGLYLMQSLILSPKIRTLKHP